MTEKVRSLQPRLKVKYLGYGEQDGDNGTIGHYKLSGGERDRRELADSLPVQELGLSNKSSRSQVQNNPKKCFFKLVTAGLQNTFPNDVIKADFSVYASSEERSIHSCANING